MDTPCLPLLTVGVPIVIAAYLCHSATVKKQPLELLHVGCPSRVMSRGSPSPEWPCVAFKGMRPSQRQRRRRGGRGRCLGVPRGLPATHAAIISYHSIHALYIYKYLHTHIISVISTIYLLYLSYLSRYLLQSTHQPI